MRVTRSLVVSSVCTLLLATAAAAQGALPPVVPSVPSSTASAGGAWFERYQDARGGPESSDRWSRTFKVGPSGSLDISNISGDIVITGGTGDEIRVEAVKRVHGRDTDEAKRQLGGRHHRGQRARRARRDFYLLPAQTEQHQRGRRLHRPGAGIHHGVGAERLRRRPADRRKGRGPPRDGQRQRDDRKQRTTRQGEERLG